MLGMPVETQVANDNTEVEQLRYQILCNFKASSYRQLRQVDVTVGDVGAVVLRGEMESYYLRQMAYQTAIETPGVFTVKDRLTVR
ncbi:hypothetical protein Pla52o_52030 [Novipirellula galeiformis]|uniref:BON domain-containing protein n=1 Tax=Novipirellula galeiformis TaxID=2528004 RepID=A0A5C6C3G7_9BACT|nr:BON domain-containing protein [Novipirellula galeiformis]TWU17399.1 hypothetical protein Pla52o_52030 [Novipirellula galeiformis]